MDKNKMKSLWKEHKALLIIIIPCAILLLAIISSMFAKPNDPYMIEFAGNTFEITDSKEDIKSEYGDAYSESEVCGALTDENNKGIALMFDDDDELVAIENPQRSKSVKVGGVSIGDTVEDVASTLGTDTDDFKNGETTLLFYRDKEIKYRERIADDFPFDSIISKGKKSDYILSIEVQNSKVKSQAIYLARDYANDAEEKLEEYYGSYQW